MTCIVKHKRIATKIYKHTFALSTGPFAVEARGDSRKEMYLCDQG